MKRDADELRERLNYLMTQGNRLREHREVLKPQTVSRTVAQNLSMPTLQSHNITQHGDPPMEDAVCMTSSIEDMKNWIVELEPRINMIIFKQDALERNRDVLLFQAAYTTAYIEDLKKEGAELERRIQLEESRSNTLYSLPSEVVYTAADIGVMRREVAEVGDRISLVKSQSDTLKQAEEALALEAASTASDIDAMRKEVVELEEWLYLISAGCFSARTLSRRYRGRKEKR
jgi:hypothetical protein